MLHDTDTDKQDIPTYSDKLVLPAPSETETEMGATAHNADAYQHTRRVQSEQLIRHTIATPPPNHPLKRLQFFWHKDPSYKVLMVAVTSVLLAGLVLATLATRAFLQNANFLSRGASYSQTAPPNVTPNSTVDLKPTFAPPRSGQGSTSSSQPPQSNPVAQPTNPPPQPQPSPSPQPGQLSVQITSVPPRVQNNSIVYVGVNASEPGVEVQLNIVYNVAPYRSFAGPRFTGGRGNANIAWNVSVFLAGHHAQAVIIVIAKDQNGQSAQSQPATIEISGNGQG
jgi:hypothetical protein